MDTLFATNYVFTHSCAHSRLCLINCKEFTYLEVYLHYRRTLNAALNIIKIFWCKLSHSLTTDHLLNQLSI